MNCNLYCLNGKRTRWIDLILDFKCKVRHFEQALSERRTDIVPSPSDGIDGKNDFADIGRLVDKASNAAAQDAGMHARVGDHREHDDRQVPMVAAQSLDQAKAIGRLAVGHRKIGDQEIGRLMAQRIQQRIRRIGLCN